MSLVFFVLGLLALVAGASLLVRGAAKLAISFGISPLVVGLTVVAFGTSAPETAVSVGAALRGSSDIAVGNVVAATSSTCISTTANAHTGLAHGTAASRLPRRRRAA